MNLQPNSDHCFICGRKNTSGLQMQFYDDGQDQVVSHYTVGEPFQGYPGLVHGGILSAMLDEVVGRVALIGDHHHFMMTVKLEVKFRHPVPVNTPLHLVGERVKIRGRIGQACGRIELPDGTIAVEAALVLADIPEPFRQADPVALGWRVDE